MKDIIGDKKPIIFIVREFELNNSDELICFIKWMKDKGYQVKGALYNLWHLRFTYSIPRLTVREDYWDEIINFYEKYKTKKCTNRRLLKGIMVYEEW